jgi:hypothetical protein
MSIWYPEFAVRRLPAMVLIGAIGAGVGGLYGVLHDQISFAISPEYFTKMKFQQFHWADVGLPPRAFASVVGFLATWWAGMFAGWFMARAGLDQMPPVDRRRTLVRGFAIVLGCAALCGAGGAAIGYGASRGDLSEWDDWRERLSLVDVPGFVIVAWLHAAGYVGALVGVITGVVYVRSCVKKSAAR